MEVNFILNLTFSREVVGDTIEPQFFEDAIIRIPQFFKLFPWSLGFALNLYKLPRIFQTLIFRIPPFFEPCFKSFPLNTLDFPNFL